MFQESGASSLASSLRLRSLARSLAVRIIADRGRERMRLLAESGRKSQFHFFAPRFRAVRFPKVHTPDGNRRRRRRRKGREEGTVARERMWLTHGQIELLPGFCILKRATKENRRNKSARYTAPASCVPSRSSSAVRLGHRARARRSKNRKGFVRLCSTVYARPRMLALLSSR